MNKTRVFELLLTDDGTLNLRDPEATDRDLGYLLPLAKMIKGLEIGPDPLITFAGIKKLAPLKKHLKYLDIWELPLDDKGLLLIVDLFPKLTHLLFGGKRVTVTLEGLEHLAGLPDLAEVTVNYIDYAARLRFLYPKLVVRN